MEGQASRNNNNSNKKASVCCSFISLFTVIQLRLRRPADKQHRGGASICFTPSYERWAKADLTARGIKSISGFNWQGTGQSGGGGIWHWGADISPFSFVYLQFNILCLCAVQVNKRVVMVCGGKAAPREKNLLKVIHLCFFLSNWSSAPCSWSHGAPFHFHVTKNFSSMWRK